jgi:3-phosphoshikimate 1-carboxyvinyltransferase
VITENLRLTVEQKNITLSETFETPGDPSSAAFFLVGASIIPNSRVTATNMLLSAERTGFLRVLDRMGVHVSLTMTKDRPEPSGEVTVEYSGPLSSTVIEADEVPSLIDEIPILALAATQAHGLTIFRKVDELRIKETDRLMSIRHQLGALGARVWIEGDDLFIQGPTPSFILPSNLDSGNDHRLAMTLSMALLFAKAKLPIMGYDSVKISYPNFEKQLASLWQT